LCLPTYARTKAWKNSLNITTYLVHKNRFITSKTMGNIINLGIIGYGYWGPNLVRNFLEIPGVQVKTVSDFKPELLAKVKGRYPKIDVTTDCREIFTDPNIDAVAIATPVSTHFDLALAALQAGKHVLVEKPMTVSSQQAIRLIEEAEKRNLVLMVDHTFVYSSAVRKMRELVAAKAIGDIYYYDSVRVNLGLFQHDVNVIWDLAVHDLSIMNYVLGTQPYAVSATGMNHVPGEPENIAYLTLFFEGNLMAHIHVNWLAPVKVRRTLIGGSQKMIVFDDLEPSEKLKIYDKGITLNGNAESVYQMMIGYRTGDMWAPHLDMTEALRVEGLHFIDCIKTGKSPITDGEAGLQVVRILEAATQSMKKQGRLIELDLAEVAVA
jgi:predicted dehydrogenase